jgi:hypothetical protein
MSRRQCRFKYLKVSSAPALESSYPPLPRVPPRGADNEKCTRETHLRLRSLRPPFRLRSFEPPAPLPLLPREFSSRYHVKITRVDFAERNWDRAEDCDRYDLPSFFPIRRFVGSPRCL